jgi:hypothetical protein
MRLLQVGFSVINLMTSFKGRGYLHKTVMSDFKKLLESTTEAEFGERLWAWTRGLLRKWLDPGLDELEASQLLWVWANKRVTPSFVRQSQRERQFKDTRAKLGGLQWAAVVFGKDVKTIRRWCGNEFFPGAVKTEGGHWRIPPQVVEEVRKSHPCGFGRRPRRVFGTKVWKRFAKDVQRVFFQRMFEAIEMEAALRDQPQSEFLTTPPPPGTEALQKLKVVVDTQQTDYVTLRNMARRLYLGNPERLLDYKLLAAALNVHPSTLYRRYTKEGVAAAIRAASKSLRQRETELEGLTHDAEPTDEEREPAKIKEMDAAEIKEMFNEIVVDNKDTPSPYLLRFDPDDMEA